MRKTSSSVQSPVLIFTMVVLTLVAAGTNSCQPRRASLPNEAIVALKALQKLQAATEVGVSFANYQTLLIDAKAAVNAASQELLAGGGATDPVITSLNENLVKAVDTYADAQAAWDEKIHGRSLSPDREPGKNLIPKYELKTTDPDEAMQMMWYLAKVYTLSASGSVNTLKGP